VIVGTGIDLFEISRMEGELARGNWRLRDGVFTPHEIEYCDAGRQPPRRYAACFAAKEAALKALGAEAADLRDFREVDVRFGTPDGIELRGRLRAMARKLGAQHITSTVAVTRNWVGAMVILESGQERPDGTFL